MRFIGNKHRLIRSSYRFFVFIVLAFFGLVAAIAAYKFLRLALTLPLLLFGVSLIFITGAIGVLRSSRFRGRAANSLKIIQAPMIFLGLLSVMTSLGFSLLNLLAYTSVSTRSEGQVLRSKKLGRYIKDNSSFWLSDDLLGYSYKANEKEITSKSILVDSVDAVSDVLYDVTYNIDKFGNRFSSSSSIAVSQDRSAVFVGGSFTFGEGLEDSETLPSLFALKSGFNVYNLGMHGYGPHQGLMQLSNPELRHRRVGDKNIDIVFYRFIVDHVSRASGYSSWDPSGPCYRLSRNQILEHVGSFEDCKSPLTKVFVDPFLKRLSTSVEPWTSSSSRKLMNYRPKDSTIKDLQTFFAVVNAMKDASLQAGAKFVVLVEDIDVVSSSDSEKCVVNKLADQVSEKLEKDGIATLRFSRFYSHAKCVNGEYVIKLFADNHPSRLANEEWSDQLTQYVK